MMDKAHYLYHRTAHFLKDRAEELRNPSDRGQTFAEYIGVIIVIAAIIAVLAVSDIGTAIQNGIKGAIEDVTKAKPGGK